MQNVCIVEMQLKLYACNSSLTTIRFKIIYLNYLIFLTLNVFNNQKTLFIDN